MKIRPVGNQLFHAGGETDKMKQMVAFCNFANTPNHTYLTLVTEETT